ncbi:MAG: ATP-binding protein [Ferruginibacter sp.]
MKLTKKLEAEIKKVMNSYWDSYLEGDLKTWASFLPSDYRNIGTNKEEEWNSKKEIVDYTKRVFSKAVGKAELRNKKTKIIPYDPYIMVHELGDLFIKMEDGWTFYQQFRLSSLLEKTNTGWKILHQHGSYPDSKTEKGDAFAFDEIKAENKKLKDAVQRRTIELEIKNRELEIETSLEKVRAVAMSMSKPDDLLNICEVLFKELSKTGFQDIRCALIHIFNDDKGHFDDYDYSDFTGGKISTMPYKGNTVVENFLKRIRKSKESFTELVVKGKELADFLNFRKKTGQLQDKRLLKTKEINYYFFSVGLGNIGISNFGKISKEQLLILKRFRNVFNLAYQRYTDISLAEAQAREAQIEVALERLRNQSMLMQHSQEIQDLSKIFHEQLHELQIPSEFSYIWLPDEKKGEHLFWATWTEQTKNSLSTESKSIVYPLDKKEKYTAACFKAWKSKTPVHIHKIPAKETAAFFEIWKELLKGAGKLKARYFRDGLFYAESYMKYGCFGINIRRTLTQEEQDILFRFTIEFERAYTRFLDLQKAEAQAREAQIEASLERVRSRSLAMHNTSELQEVIHAVHKEFIHLNIAIDGGSFIAINSDIDTTLRCWGSGGTADTTEEVNIPLYKKPFCTNLINRIKKGPRFYTETFTQKEKKDFFTFLFKHEPWSKLKVKEKKETLSSPGGYTRSVCVSEHTSIFIINHHGEIFSADDNDILKRFGKVFEQSYTRFLDLQKAEAQTRESQIELGLERVRARAMAMQTSAELSALVDTVFKELANLDFALSWCIINIIDEPSLTNMVWAANPDTNKPPESYLMKFEDYPFHHSMMKGYRERKPKHVYVIEGKEKKEYDEYLFNKTEWRRVPKKAQAASRAMKRYVASFTFSNFGGLQTVTEEPLSDDSLDILHRFGKVFDGTYTRFNDLLKSEAQAREAEIELALERVRARTMAMQHSDELSASSLLLDQQVRALGIKTRGCAFNIYGKDDSTEWFSSEAGTIPSYKTPREKIFKKYYQLGLSGTALHIEKFDDKACAKHYDYLETIPIMGDDIRHLKKIGAVPERQIDHIAYFKYGYLLFVTLDAVAEAHDIFKRFAKVFEQTYTRFLDLQKAEASAREAQIEAAVERVRAEAMAMHSTSDFEKVVKQLLQQIQHLNLEGFTGAQIILIDEKEFLTTWDCSSPGNISDPKSQTMRYEARRFPILGLEVLNKWKEGHPYFVMDFDLKKLRAAVLEWEKIDVSIAKVIKKAISTGQLTHQWEACGRLSNGMIAFDMTKPPDDDIRNITIKMTHAFEQAYTRFLDLQKAEASAREAQIEAALERVRSQSMGMQTSKDLSNVTTAMFEQLRMLGSDLFATGIVFCDKHEGHVEQWHSLPEAGMISPFIVPVNLDYIHQYRYDQWKQGTELFSIEIPGDFIEQHFNDIFSLPSAQVVLKEFEANNTPMPATPPWEIDYGASFKHGYILASALQPFAEANILPRFAKVFEQTYIRFLDLQKAEEQAREAKIEASLERVRSKAMAMHNSQDLADTIGVFYKELQTFSITPRRCGVGLLNKENKEGEIYTWNTNEHGESLELIGTIKMEGHPILEKIHSSWLTKTEYHPILRGNEIKEYYKIVRPMVAFPDYAQDVVQYGYFFYFNEGGVYAWTEKEMIGEELQIFRRFTSVLSLTYKRYKDLILAEAQAREAKIEMALEKIRSRTMAMQHSDELPEAANLLFLEVQALGIPAWSAGYNILSEDKKSSHCIMSSEGEMQIPFKLPLTEHSSLIPWYEAIKNDLPFFVYEQGGEDLVEHYRYMATLPELEPTLKQFADAGIALPTHQINHLVQFPNGFLLFITYEQVPEAHDIFQRFTKVFEQTYTRFLDLKKSEAQTRQAQIEVALERVRARALAMQQPEELKEVAEVLRQEMGLLGVEELETCSIYINDENAEQAECWYALKDLRSEEKKLVNDHFALNLNDTWVGREMLSFYNSEEKQISILMAGINRVEWIRFCEANSAPFRGYYGDEIPDRTYHLYKFSHGAIGAASAGDISEESWNLLRRAASVFSLAYSRFKDLTQARIDLQKLKEEKQRAEDALSNLQAAQKQLVQSEKMASLGELTAGIAHEIQNPLNFVNNFSEVSKELLDEIKEEMEKGNLEDAKEIMKDVIQNLEKINHHGKRADGIVKGMLQHSRSSSGTKEPTDINALADEYLRLAYHGLRAKDKSFNAIMKTDFDTSLEKVNVIPQDIGRVILNLITNAFYVVNEKKQQKKDGYEPTVTVSSKKINGSVEISVADNGNGIPQKVLDKIFQPFFTTKPTGQGTGLGLSLAFDIVTKGHGGELLVETKEGKGSEFTIQIPTG